MLVLIPAAAEPAVPQHVALSVAGSDPSGGAGIQADLKTFAVIGVYGAAAVTCLTAQNTHGVEGVQPISPEFVRAQIEPVLTDLPVTHVKTGMIGTAAIAAAVGKILRDFPGQIVCDPVLNASDGQSLFETTALKTFCADLVSTATVLTPNLYELETLVGASIRAEADVMAAAEELFQRFPRLEAIAAKGGHHPETADGKITDLLILRPARNGLESLRQVHPRLRTANAHGTGCTFSAAYTAFHLLYGGHRAAFTHTVAFLDRLLQVSRSAGLGHGPHGPMLHHLLRKI